MKKIISTLCTFFIVAIVMAQVPDVMNYQAVARNTAGAALANQTIKVRLSIMKNAIMQYSETRQVTTNALGLFNVQIGSAGALVTTGTFSTINWQNNAAPGYVLKVELDISNSNVFTDMGSQSLVTVPYAFATKKADQATETVNLAGRPLDIVTAPATNSRLSWDGSNWTPVKKDTVIFNSKNIPNIASGGTNANWVFTQTTPVSIPVTGSEVIAATFTGEFGHTGSNFVPMSCSVCYQETSSGAITSFFGTNEHELYIPINTTAPRTQLTATGAIKLPAGTYRIGMCIKNKSGTGQSLNNNGFTNGFIEVKY